MKAKFSDSKLLTSTLIALSILILLGGLFFALQIYTTGRITPGVRVGQLNLGFKNAEQAEQLITNQASLIGKQEFSITFGEETVSTSLEELEIEILPAKTVENLKKDKHMQASVIAAVINEPVQVTASVKINSNQVLEDLKEDLGVNIVAAQNATFYFDDAGRLQISESKPGIQINESKLLADIKNNAESLSVKDIEIEYEQADPEITSEMLQNQLPQIQSTLAHQVELIDPIYSDPWFVSLNTYKDWVVFEENKSSMLEAVLFSDASSGDDFESTHNYISISIDPVKFNEFVDAEISEWLDHPVDPVNIYTDEEGEVVIEGVGIEGTEIEREKLLAYYKIALATKADEFVIPIKMIEPELIVSPDLQELGITEIVGVGHTSFYGSPANRVHNIKVGSEKFNGDLIAPDEVYSFNTNLGAVDASTGFRKELVIKPEGTIPEYGGGICQVSTTLYRAILFSDLSIAERHNHSYAVGYYSQVMGHGLDATIYLGGPDLQFVNDTGHHLLMQFYVKDDYELYVIFYGTQKDFEVEFEGPYISGHYNPGPTQYIESATMAPGQTKQVEKPHTGFNVVWYKHITYADGTKETEEIFTKYKAVPRKILVAPGETPT